MTSQPNIILPKVPILKKLDSLFLKPLKNVFFDIVFFSIINFLLVYALLFIIPDSAVAMIGVIWVGLIAWRGGITAGLMGCNFIMISTGFGLHLHQDISIQFYFGKKIPGYVLGLLQNIFCGTIVGYISTLVHKLNDEIKLRKKTQAELEQKLTELDAFGHTLAHDLKNPLTVISMSIGALMNNFEKSEDSKTRKKLSFINNSTKQMINIIESILLLSGLKKIEPKEFTVFSISQSVNEALKRMEYQIESNDVQILQPLEWPSVRGYAPWITEIWVNYINNAIKYGGNPALHIKPIVELGFDKPKIDATTNLEQIRFWIKDNGDGIAKDKINTLFTEFTRLHSTEFSGHGLGLSIVKTIVDKFNGTVGVESETGHGSLFYFTLPVNKPLY